MTLEELQELADKDIKINDTELDLESLKTPAVHNKYCKFHNKFNNKFNNLYNAINLPSAQCYLLYHKRPYLITLFQYHSCQ